MQAQFYTIAYCIDNIAYLSMDFFIPCKHTDKREQKTREKDKGRQQKEEGEEMGTGETEN